MIPSRVISTVRDGEGSDIPRARGFSLRIAGEAQRGSLSSASHHDAMLIGEDHCVHSVGKRELLQHPGNMRLDRRLAHVESDRDFRVAHSPCEQAEYLALPPAQVVECDAGGGYRRCAVSAPLDDPAGDIRIQQSVAAADDLHRFDELFGGRILEQKPLAPAVNASKR